MKKVLVGIAMVALISFFSCEQEKINTSENQKIESSAQDFLVEGNTSSTVAIISENPYDYVGEQHNIGLDAIMRKFPDGINKENFSTGELQTFFGEDASSELYDTIQKYITLEDCVRGFPNVLDLIQDPKAKECVAGILHEIRHAKFENIKEFATYINTVEKRIKDTFTLTKQDKESILSMLSVYRHSAQYWGTEYKGGYILLWSWRNFFITVTCDAVGALIGGLIGSGCPVTGTVGGAIQGGVLASALAYSLIKVVEYEEPVYVF